ncbi:hypothetical protein F0562_004337 [Nyssa sinensis]|uniref:Uncharacterized protein n=1 Tax=Nyssa sinensis TaxID=561372 RepID=A0A5J5BY90_9ASTE|nr:hypothetical protein F0562_004337 [Nyssa sinensis]
MAAAAKSLVQTLKRYIKKPWEITGPCAGPEYKSAVPGATEYRVFCPATVPWKAIVPTSNPETVYDIKYYTRDQRRSRGRKCHRRRVPIRLGNCTSRTCFGHQ